MASQAVAKRDNGHGGSRVGAGRKTRGLGEKTRAYAAQAAEAGVKPIDVILGNMRYYHERAEDFDTKLEEVARIMTPAQIAAGGDAVIEVLKLVAKIGEFRMKAQACAVDAAPYIHARLSALAVKVESGDSKKPPLEITRQMAPRIAADIYAAMLAEDD